MASRIITFCFLAFGAGFSFITAIIFIYLCIRYIILKSQASIEIQDVLKFYIFIEILNGVVVSFYLIQSCIVYRVEDTIVYATPLLFWSITLQNITSLLRPIAILTLGLDRIFIILLPIMREIRRKVLSFFIGVSLMVISIILLLVLRIIPNILTKPFITNCITFSCLGNKGNAAIFIALRTIFGLLNFMSGVILIVSIRKRSNTMNFTGVKKKGMMVVIFTLFTTILLNFLPNLVGYMCLIVSL